MHPPIAKISRFCTDVWMFDRERVVAADKAEYKDFNVPMEEGCCMMVDRSLAQCGVRPEVPFGPAET